MDTEKPFQKTSRRSWLHRASETRQRSEHICDEAAVAQEVAKDMVQMSGVRGKGVGVREVLHA